MDAAFFGFCPSSTTRGTLRNGGCHPPSLPAIKPYNRSPRHLSKFSISTHAALARRQIHSCRTRPAVGAPARRRVVSTSPPQHCVCVAPRARSAPRQTLLHDIAPWYESTTLAMGCGKRSPLGKAAQSLHLHSWSPVLARPDEHWHPSSRPTTALPNTINSNPMRCTPCARAPTCAKRRWASSYSPHCAPRETYAAPFFVGAPRVAPISQVKKQTLPGIVRSVGMDYLLYKRLCYRVGRPLMRRDAMAVHVPGSM